MADQKPVDSAQIVLDKRNAAPASGSGTCAMGGIGCLVLKVVAVLFVVGNVTALYVLHFVNRPSPTTRFSFSNFAAVEGSSAKVGQVVSLSSNSQLRNGAGTTAYLNRASLNDSGVTYYEYINVAKLGTTTANYLTNLMSYRRVTSTATESVLTTFTTNVATKEVTVKASTTNNVLANVAIRGLATISDTAALVMTVDDSSWPYSTYVTSTTISDKGDVSISTSASAKQKVTTSSATNYIAPLNAKSAIIAYYDPYDPVKDYFQRVVVATVGSDGAVTLSTAMSFGPANNAVTSVSVTWGKPVTISAIDGSFAIPYYTGTSGLCLTMSTYTTQLSTFTTGVCNTNFKPAYYPEGVMLSDNIMLIAFHDSGNNNVLTLVTAYVTATNAYFRSSFVFPDVAGPYVFGEQYGFSPDVSLALLSGNRVAVSFMNPTMNGRPSVKIVKYSLNSLSFKDVTPVMPAATSSFTLDVNGGTVKKSVTQRILAVGTDSVVAVHLGARGASKYQEMALIEAYGSPVGVLRDLDGKTKASVAISGKAKDVHTKGNKDLVTGTFYYATTAGYVASPATSSSSVVDVFVSNEDANTIVTADSKIGLAVDDDELFVSTAF